MPNGKPPVKLEPPGVLPTPPDPPAPPDTGSDSNVNRPRSTLYSLSSEEHKRLKAVAKGWGCTPEEAMSRMINLCHAMEQEGADGYITRQVQKLREGGEAMLIEFERLLRSATRHEGGK